MNGKIHRGIELTMMKLSTMQAVVATLNERWESPLADEILARWEHDEGSAKYLRASANFVFFFKQANQKYILRFNHASERQEAQIQAELDYVNYLADAGLRVAKPVRSAAGNFVETVATAQGIFFAVVFEGLAGEQPEFEALTPAHFTAWGKALGELHTAAQAYLTPGRPTWQDHLTATANLLPAEEQAAQQTLASIREQLAQLAINEQNFGLIHYDFELDNLVWHEEAPGMIDFDDSAWYWFAADIAFALRDLFNDSAAQVDLQHPTFLHFMAGYQAARPIAASELALIPLFLRLHNLVLFAKLHRALTPVSPEGDLPWVPALRSKLATVMQEYRAGFG